MRFSDKNGIKDKDLSASIERAEKGLIDADLGGGVIKQRLPRKGGGLSGGYRSIILYKKSDSAFFVYGWAKSDMDNITKADERAFKKMAGEIFALDAEDLKKAIECGELTEVRS